MASLDLKLNSKKIEGLVEMVKNGDHEAFSELYDMFVDPLYRYIYFRVKNDDVEDLLETVFLKVWENINKYKKDKKSGFSAWIFRIAHNLVVDHYRSMKSKEFFELSINVPDYKREHNPIKSTQHVFNKDVLKIALSKIKKRYQEIIIYKFINELSNKEIADILDKSEGSLRILQFRALQSLRKELEILGVDASHFV